MSSIQIDTGCAIRLRGKKKDLWYIKFTEKGRQPYQKEISLKTGDRATAMRLAYKMCDDWKRGAFDPWQNVETLVTVKQALRDFERIRGPELQHWKDNVWALRKLCEEARITRVRALSPSDVRRFIWQRDIRPATRFSYYNKLSGIVGWLAAQGYLDKNPMDDVARPPEPKELPKYYNGDELAFLLNACDVFLEANAKNTHRKSANPDWFKDAFELIAFTGMRKMDTNRLTWGDIEFPTSEAPGEFTTDGRLYIKESKWYTARVVPILPHSCQLLRRIESKTRLSSDPNEVVLKRFDGCTPVIPDRVSRKFTKVQQFAKLKPIGLHGLRHTFAVMLVFAGVHMRAIQLIMGHKDIQTTMKYTQLSNDDVLRLTLEKFI